MFVQAGGSSGSFVSALSSIRACNGPSLGPPEKWRAQSNLSGLVGFLVGRKARSKMFHTSLEGVLDRSLHPRGSERARYGANKCSASRRSHSQSTFEPHWPIVGPGSMAVDHPKWLWPLLAHALALSFCKSSPPVFCCRKTSGTFRSQGTPSWRASTVFVDSPGSNG